MRRGVRLKFYSHDDPTMAELADELDETLFTAVLNNDGGAENAGVENAGVEKAGAITYGKPSEQKTLKTPGV